MADTSPLMYEIAGGLTNAPNIPVPERVNMDALKRSLSHVFPDGNLVLATLPIGQVNVRSRNNNLYGKRAMEKLVSLVKTTMPEGNWGHIKESDIGTWYAPADVRWLDAQMAPDGVVWGLALAMTKDTATYFSTAAALNAKVGTSIFAQDVKREGEEIVDFDRLRIDLADPTRVGVPITATVPNVRTEMEDPSSQTEDQPVSETKTPTPVQESGKPAANTNSVVVPADHIANETIERGKLREQITILEKEKRALMEQSQDWHAIRELLDVKPDQDIVQVVRELSGNFKAIAEEQSGLISEFINAEIKKAVGGDEGAAGVVLELVEARKPLTKKAAEQAIQAVMDREAIKKLVASRVQEIAGGNQTRPTGHGTNTNTSGKDGLNEFLQDRPK